MGRDAGRPAESSPASDEVFMFPNRALLLLAFALAVPGCASTANPVFNSSVPEPHLYSEFENQPGIGVPDAIVGATGEVRYCQAGLPQLVKARQEQAYAAIARACGGEDRYVIRGELMSDATGRFLGVSMGCTGNAGRAIVFECTEGDQP